MEWQPIETAPKDGTLILVYTVIPGHTAKPHLPQTFIDIAYYRRRWYSDDDDPRNWVRAESGNPTCGEAGGKAVGAAAHWMPLPKPPES